MTTTTFRVEITGRDPLGLREECEAFVNSLDLAACEIPAAAIVERAAELEIDAADATRMLVGEWALAQYLATIDDRTTGADALVVTAE